ncbi:MAG: 4-phosphoerythronate dehydrogenase PdxB [Phycisphaerae bacterium]|nr:4-phosphoerythronate dehydrogenase PdxB [Phycisphaerae bacterium]
MHIVADENIPYVHEAFDRLGTVRTLAGRTMTDADVASADVLLVRSVTKVNADLLAGSNARFVGTATIGTDHVDTAHLASRGIAFSSAAGSNANSVAEYVMAQLLTLGERLELDLPRLTLGVVGVGNIGRLVVRDASAMGMRVLQNDPPRARAEGGDPFVGLDTISGECDVVTLHTPLNREGVDKTVHLFDAARISRLRPGAVLMNSGRGPVVDNKALLNALNEGKTLAACLDVWENEPDIDVELLKQVQIGSPHIAGYSFDGKVAGTKMLFDAVCRTFDLTETWDPSECLPPPTVPELTIDAAGRRDQDVLREAVKSVYDIEADDARLRAVLDTPSAERGKRFDQLRKDYPIRREFFNTLLTVVNGSGSLRKTLLNWGFRAEG